MKNLKEKVVIISGAASGIGKALALNFAQAGSHLALNDFDEAGLNQTLSELKQYTSVKIISSVFDVSKVELFEQFAQKVEATFGRADIVINNAGVALGKVTIEELAYKDLEWVMNINFWGMVYGTKTFLPLLKKQAEAAVVNVSSIFGIVGIGHQGAYCSSKFAIRGFTEALRMESLMEFPQVTVHTIHPGGIQTNIAKNSKWVGKEVSEAEHAATTETFEKMFITTAEVAAQKIVKGIRKKHSKILIGNDAWRMDWLARLMPEGYSKVLKKQLERNGLG